MSAKRAFLYTQSLFLLLSYSQKKDILFLEYTLFELRVVMISIGTSDVLAILVANPVEMAARTPHCPVAVPVRNLLGEAP
jgi:hypothetical protein